jgi:hypothetical protein
MAQNEDPKAPPHAGIESPAPGISIEDLKTVLRNNSCGDAFRVQRLQRQPDSGMMSACCSWRERLSE